MVGIIWGKQASGFHPSPCTLIILTAPQACRDRAEGYIQLSLGSVKAGVVWSTVLKWPVD